jgi:glycerol-3-phosphate acyltransferase PlsY
MLVLVLDGLKAVIPMAVARIWIFSGGSALDYGALYLMGISAVAGHIFPLWYGFKGGGGVSTMQGVSLWFIPVEYLVTMLVSGFLALGLFRHKGLWLTQWTPILFITLTPFVTLVVNLNVNLTIWKGISLGGHPWTVIAGCFALSLMMMGLNIRLLAAKMTGKNWEKTSAPHLGRSEAISRFFWLFEIETHLFLSRRTSYVHSPSLPQPRLRAL